MVGNFHFRPHLDMWCDRPQVTDDDRVSLTVSVQLWGNKSDVLIPLSVTLDPIDNRHSVRNFNFEHIPQGKVVRFLSVRHDRDFDVFDSFAQQVSDTLFLMNSEETTGLRISYILLDDRFDKDLIRYVDEASGLRQMRRQILAECYILAP
jgi:hypothetical protein